MPTLSLSPWLEQGTSGELAYKEWSEELDGPAHDDDCGCPACCQCDIEAEGGLTNENHERQ